MILTQKKKYRPKEQDEKTRETHAPLGTLSLTKEAIIHRGRNTASSISGAEKSGHFV